MNNTRLVRINGSDVRLTNLDADCYEIDIANADRGGSSTQRRSARKRVDDEYRSRAIHVVQDDVTLFETWGEKATDEECHETILLILNHLGLKAVRTKSGVELKGSE